MNRPTLKIKTNIETHGKLLFDTPIEGDGKHGPYHIYALTVDGEEMSWFATDMTHELIQDLGLKRGDDITLLKEEIADNKTQFRVNGKMHGDVEHTGQPAKQGDELQTIINVIDGALIKLQAYANTNLTKPNSGDDIPF